MYYAWLFCAFVFVCYVLDAIHPAFATLFVTVILFGWVADQFYRTLRR